MKKRPILTNRPVRKRHRKSLPRTHSYGVRRYLLPVFSAIHWIGTGMVKVFVILSVITVISLSFTSLYRYLLSSPYMKLERVEMEGVEGKIRDELIRESGLNSDLSLLALNLNKLKKKMEEHPWIRSVRLERRFPHSLFVHVEKEHPLGVVVMDRLYYINKEGEMFKEVSQSESVDFPFITGVDKEEAKRGNKLRRAAYFIKALETVEEPWSLNHLSEVNVGEEKIFSLYYKNIGAEIKLTGSHLGRVVDKLRQVASHIKWSGRIDQVNTIDLSYTDGVVVSFRDGIKGTDVSDG
jgi:cell division protein FtsQ